MAAPLLAGAAAAGRGMMAGIGRSGQGRLLGIGKQGVAKGLKHNSKKLLKVEADMRKVGKGVKVLGLAIEKLPGVLTIGIPDGEVYHPDPRVKPRPLATIIFTNELGSPSRNIPARPALAQAIAVNQEKWLRSMISRSHRVLRGQDDIDKSMNRLGNIIVVDIQRAYGALTKPVNAESTLYKKRSRSDRALLDYGVISNAFQYLWVGDSREIKKELKRIDKQGQWLITNGKVST